MRNLLVLALILGSCSLSLAMNGNPKPIWGLDEAKLDSNLFDLGFCYIKRSPAYTNDMHSIGSANMPKPGDKLVWTGYLYSNGKKAPIDKAKISWAVNGCSLEGGPLLEAPEMGPNFYKASLPWQVPENYRTDYSKALTNVLVASLSYSEGLKDRIESNNVLRVFMDALTLSIPISTNTLARYTNPEGLSFFDRFNDCLEWTNQRFAAAIYPLSPYGIIDRYRVDKMYLVDEEFVKAYYEGDPAVTTTIIFNEQGPKGNYHGYAGYWIGQNFWFQGKGIFSDMGYGAFCHEVGHSLQIPDTYCYNVRKNLNWLTDEEIPCAWMDSPGKRCMMRDSYGPLSHFSELTAAVANQQAGVMRKKPHYNVEWQGQSYTGCVYALLPREIEVKFYAKSGREAVGLPITIHRMLDLDYFIGVTNNPILEVSYPAGGIKFDPKFKKENGTRGGNSFFMRVAGQSFVLDQLHFNYRYIKGETETQTFAITNDFAEVNLASARLEVLPGAKNLLLSLMTDTRKGVMVRCAYALEDLAKTGWTPLTDAMIIGNCLSEGENTIYAEAKSIDGLSNGPRAFTFTYDSQNKTIRK